MPVARGAFKVAATDFVDTLKVGNRAKQATTEYIEDLEKEAADFLKPVLEQFGIYDEFKKILDLDGISNGTATRPIFLPLLLVAGGALIGGLVNSILSPATNNLTQGANQVFQASILNPAMLIAATYRFPNLDAKWIDMFHRSGFADDLVKDMLEISRPQKTENDLLSLWLRSELSDIELKTRMAEKGWSIDEIDEYTKLAFFVPPVQDLIRFAVRESTRIEVVEKYGYDEFFPTEILPLAKQQGITEENMKLYWRAHWDIPSVGQGYDMMHRLRPGRTDNPFTENDLMELMGIADIPDFFRKRLAEISFLPLGRIDIRRAYELDRLTEDEMYEKHLDLGYSPDNARILTDFTVQERAAARIDVSKGLILRAYKNGYIGRTLAQVRLKEIGIAVDGINFELGLIDHALAEELQEEKIKHINALYVEGIISEAQMISDLGALRLEATYQSTLIIKWRRQRQSKITLPSKTDIEKWYEVGIIGDLEYERLMLERGYRLLDVIRYKMLLNIKIGEDNQKELERAQKESVRMQQEGIATIYQRTIASFGVKVAEITLAIANKRVAIGQTENESQINELHNDITELQREVREINLEKARLKINQP